MNWKWTSLEIPIIKYLLFCICLILFVLIAYKFFNKHRVTTFAIVLPSLLFILLIEELVENELSIFDNTIYGYIQKFISEDMTEFLKLTTSLGSGLTLILISLIGIGVFRKSYRYSYYSKMAAINLIIVSILNEVFKVIFHRERPDILRLTTAGGFSFPSGHTMISMSFYGFIAYLVYKNMKNRRRYLIVGLLLVIVLLIGISRVYLGVHYASDVIAGFSAGIAWLAIFIGLVNKIHPQN